MIDPMKVKKRKKKKKVVSGAVILGFAVSVSVFAVGYWKNHTSITTARRL